MAPPTFSGNREGKVGGAHPTERSRDESLMHPIHTRDIETDLAILDSKIKAFLPPQYQHCYGSVSPTSMGSAGVRYGPDGKVAWDQIWTTFWRMNETPIAVISGASRGACRSGR